MPTYVNCTDFVLELQDSDGNLVELQPCKPITKENTIIPTMVEIEEEIFDLGYKAFLCDQANSHTQEELEKEFYLRIRELTAELDKRDAELRTQPRNW